jgi:hypothetical protein
MCFLALYWSSNMSFNARGNRVSVNLQPTETHVQGCAHTSFFPRLCNAAKPHFLFLWCHYEKQQSITGQIHTFLPTKSSCSQIRNKQWQTTFLKALDLTILVQALPPMILILLNKGKRALSKSSNLFYNTDMYFNNMFY